MVDKQVHEPKGQGAIQRKSKEAQNTRKGILEFWPAAIKERKEEKVGKFAPL